MHLLKEILIIRIKELIRDSPTFANMNAEDIGLKGAKTVKELDLSDANITDMEVLALNETGVRSALKDKQINQTRQNILTRIDEIKRNENGFRKGTQRWDNFTNGGTETKHISEIDFSTLDDFTLVYLFERIIRRYNSQM